MAWPLTFDAALLVPRFAIAGGPDAGKTALANWAAAGRFVLHTDIYRAIDWADVPAAVIAGCANRDRLIVEGVQVARALRAGLQVDAVLWLGLGRDCAFAKGVQTVFREWAATARCPVIERAQN